MDGLLLGAGLVILLVVVAAGVTAYLGSKAADQHDKP
jgi:hypothetical protein